MSDAYESEKLITYSVQIECVAVCDNYLVVGSCLGHVMWYTTSPKLKLVYSDKTFSTKPIQQLAALSGRQIVVCQSVERGVSVIETCVCQTDRSVQNVVTDVPQTRGASCFTLDVEIPDGTQSNRSGNADVRLCVAVKKEFKIYRWNGKRFSHCQSIDVRLDTPHTMIWCNQSIIIGCRHEYFSVDVNTKDVIPLILTGKCPKPIIVKISDAVFGLVKDSQLTVMTANGVAGRTIIRLEDSPYFIAYDAPYLLASVGNKLFVQALEPSCDGNASAVRQEISINSKIVKIVSGKNGLIYAISALGIWRLKAVQIDEQIERLVEERDFRLALKLASVSGDVPVDDKIDYETRIRKLLADDLFRKKMYQESMNEFLKSNIDPHDVIGLFPNLLPQSNDLNDQTEMVDGEDTTAKIDALIEYLTEVRRNVFKQTTGVGNDPNETNCYREQLLRTVDSTLLKCYLQTNDALIAPLIRLNKCRFPESEATLKQYKKYNELIILYQMNGLHRKALEFLREQSNDPESILKGPERTIRYLQYIDAKDIDIVFEFSNWVLDECPEEGLGIFTEDVGEVELWPRSAVLNYFNENHRTLCVRYLEHVIHVWKDTSCAFHEALIYRYSELLPRHDRGGGGNTREKLLAFLRQSDHYDRDRMLVHFPIRDECLEEHVIVLEKLGRHNQVLSIYVYKLNNIDEAIKHCDKVYASNDEKSDQIYVTLLRLLNNPPDLRWSWIDELLGSAPKLPPNMEKTIEILNKYTGLVSPSDALHVVPDDIPVYRVSQYLLIALESVISERKRLQLNTGLLHSRYIHMEKQRILYEKQKVVLTKHDKCTFCKNLIGNNSAFVRDLDGEIAHYSCYTDNSKSNRRGRFVADSGR